MASHGDGKGKRGWHMLERMGIEEFQEWPFLRSAVGEVQMST